MHEFARVCEQAARAGGAVLRKMQGKVSAREKGPADLVTEADLASQETVRRLVLETFPDHGFLGEEILDETENTDVEREFTWIVDPLDGTTNYVHGLDNYCVSVALMRGDQILLGTVYDPVREHCYTAAAGQGAFCNGQPIQCSYVKSLDQALVAASLPVQVQPDSVEIRQFLNVLYACQAMRRLGSAALNLCHVASGNMDGYWATSVKKWDVAAGLLLVEEAGGVFTGIDGGPLNLDQPRFAAAANATLHAELLQALSLST